MQPLLYFTAFCLQNANNLLTIRKCFSDTIKKNQGERYVKNQEFYRLIKDIVTTKEFRDMRHYQHHIKGSVYDHSIKVAYLCYCHYKKYGLDMDLRRFVRAALLHDFYLYDWRESKKEHMNHSYIHPKIALENAKKEFGELNEIEEDIILSHMWPVTLFKFPKYKESYLVCFSDKICAMKEFFGNVRNKKPNKKLK